MDDTQLKGEINDLSLRMSALEYLLRLAYANQFDTTIPAWIQFKETVLDRVTYRTETPGPIDASSILLLRGHVERFLRHVEGAQHPQPE